VRNLSCEHYIWMERYTIPLQRQSHQQVSQKSLGYQKPLHCNAFTTKFTILFWNPEVMNYYWWNIIEEHISTLTNHTFWFLPDLVVIIITPLAALDPLKRPPQHTFKTLIEGHLSGLYWKFNLHIVTTPQTRLI
jgi:hypothetical protein